MLFPILSAVVSKECAKKEKSAMFRHVLFGGKPNLPGIVERLFGELDRLSDVLGKAFLTNDQDEWTKILKAAGLAFTTVSTVSEVLKDEHVAQNGAFAKVGGQLLVKLPLDFSMHQHEPKALAPALGSHNSKLLR